MNEKVFQEAELIAGYLKGSLTPDEERELSSWINDAPGNRYVFDLLTNPETLRTAITRHDDRRKRVIDDLQTAVRFPDRTLNKPWSLWRDQLVLITMILVVLIIAIVLWIDRPQRGTLSAIGSILQEEITPGSGEARLYLEDSSVVIMVDTINGLIAPQSDGDVKVLKENGWLYYHSSHPGDTICYNALEVPRKGIFRVIFSDGSRAWLNAASNLRYPALFGNNSRRVQLSGEGYFEVTGLPATQVNPVAYADRAALATARPFLIDIAGGQGPAQVRVTGSRFNVRAYPDEDFIEVLSLEGAVQVEKGEHQVTVGRNQSVRIYRNGDTKMRSDVSPGPFVAWKDNLFKFEDTPFHEAMKGIERWYDVQTDYGGRTFHQTVTGVYERAASLPDLLHYLAYQTGKEFKLHGNTILVKP